jgi:hypothetical protein
VEGDDPIAEKRDGVDPEDEPVAEDESPSDADPWAGEDSADGNQSADEERCIALTRDGDRCSRSAADGGDYCHQHAPEN